MPPPLPVMVVVVPSPQVTTAVKSVSGARLLPSVKVATVKVPVLDALGRLRRCR